MTLVCFVLLVFAAGWGYLYTHSHAINAEKQNEILAMLKDIKQMDANWNVDVLKSQSELNLNYDPLTQPLINFPTIFESLNTETKYMNDAELEKSISGIHENINEKASLIDRFKAQKRIA